VKVKTIILPDGTYGTQIVEDSEIINSKFKKFENFFFFALI
jgi:hypothetical protein